MSANYSMEIAPVLLAGAWREAHASHAFQACDPTTGERIGPRFPVSMTADIDIALAAAREAATPLAASAPEKIAEFLERYADSISTASDQLVAIAHQETALASAPRLRDIELPRTTHQLKLAAQAVRQRSWTHPVIDTEGNLRAHFAPLEKPVLIFGPNNFPFAFNAITGSDFASAIAARNPVIAKAHPSHPHTSQRLATLAHQALLETGLPAASVQMLYDFSREDGLRLAGNRGLGAIGFTGSRQAGMALKAAADAAGVPIYAEMSSINPVFLLDGVLQKAAEDTAQAFFASCTMGSGQFCTNPGIVVAPGGAAGDTFVAHAASTFTNAQPMVLFSSAVQQHLSQAIDTLLQNGARRIGGRDHAANGGFYQAPLLLSVDAATFLNNAQALQQEAFGPVSLVVRYQSVNEAIEIAESFDGNLTGSLHYSDDAQDVANAGRIARALRPRVGRLIENKWPTGVAVSPAMQHGGPYPSTSHAGFTSVGMPSAIHRFSQLQSFDSASDALLPDELKSQNPLGIQRLLNGLWTTAAG